MRPMLCGCTCGGSRAGSTTSTRGIDRLYIALGGGTVLLAAIGLGSAFIVRGG